jgi:Flp pilus assembly pilin Flp
MNPLKDPRILYLRTLLAVRVDRLRAGTDRSRGASAIEWAIITGILALIAIGIGVTIKNKVDDAASNIQTK